MTLLHLDINDIKHYNIPTLIGFIILIATIIFGILFILYTIFIRNKKHTGILIKSRTIDANNNNINN